MLGHHFPALPRKILVPLRRYVTFLQAWLAAHTTCAFPILVPPASPSRHPFPTRPLACLHICNIGRTRRRPRALRPQPRAATHRWLFRAAVVSRPPSTRTCRTSLPALMAAKPSPSAPPSSAACGTRATAGAAGRSPRPRCV